MKIRNKITMTIIGIILVVGATTFTITFYFFNRMNTQNINTINTLINSEIEDSSKSIQASLNKQIDIIGFRALSMASLFSEIPDVIQAYRIALSGNINNPNSPQSQKAREALRKIFKPVLTGYSSSTEGNVLKLHFHLPNGRSLVRLWRNGYQTTVQGRKVDISDDLTSFRNTILQINKKPYKPITGIEIGRGGFAIRGITSVKDNRGNHLGSVEVLFPFSEVFKNLNSSDNTFYAAYMNSDQLKTAKSLNDPVRYPVIDNKYVLTDVTDPDITNTIVTGALLTKGSKSIYREIFRNYAVTVFPIKDFTGKNVGIITAVKNISKILNTKTEINNKTAREMKTFISLFIIIILVTAGIGILIGYFIIRKITVSLTRVNETLSEIAEGEGDLTTKLEVTTSDEIGSLSQSFNAFINTLKDMIDIIKGSANKTIGVKDSLNNQVESATSAVTEIIANIASTIKSIETLKVIIINTTESTTGIKREVKDLDNIIQRQSEAIENSSSAVNQMVASIHNVSSITTGKKETTGTLLTNTEKGEMVIASTIKAIGAIEENIESIGGMVTIINNISAQTNLLAMNAAIEAAHAGDAGRGFAVVADEIRILAENAASNAKNIKIEIKSIIERIKEAVREGDKTTRSFSEISLEVKSVYNAFSEILTTTEELAEGGTQILKSIETLNDISEKVTSSSGNITATIDELNETVATVERVSLEVSGSIDEIAAGAEEIEKVTVKVSEATEQLSKESEKLKSETDKFTTEETDIVQ